MKKLRFSDFARLLACVTVTVMVVLMLATGAFAARKYKIIYSFKGSPKGRALGRNPSGNLAIDAGRDLYGTTGGGPNVQIAFKLTPASKGNWKETVLGGFGDGQGTCDELCDPNGDLIFDGVGNLYGTASAYSRFCCANGGGVFEVRSTGGETPLYWFQNGGDSGCYEGDGCDPQGGLIFDPLGNLYGTTWGGGASNYGTVFDLSPSGGGNWTENILYNFINAGDGEYPIGALSPDTAGNYYGTAGTIFELAPVEGGGWSFTTLYENIGAYGNLVFDGLGNLYGTSSPGAYGYGDVFELSPNSGGGWTETVLYSFTGTTDGNNPWGSLVIDSQGNLYGTTQLGGNMSCDNENGQPGCGTVFELTPGSGNGWTETVLHAFSGKNGDGIQPEAGVVLDSKGNIYGTASYGGKRENKGDAGPGIAFEITP
jgi:uncharacterized repeat protein (TIGR03803 family)